MARTIDYWFQQMQTQKNADSNLNGLNSTSKTAIYILIMYVVAFCAAALDNLFDLHRTDVDNDIAVLKPHTLTWYRQLALNFQYGQNTIADSDQYANTGLTADQIQAQKIISQAAVTEVSNDGIVGLRMKVVTGTSNAWEPLTTDQKTAFSEFINEQKDAGVNIIIDSLPPDDLRLQIDIWYNALVLLPTGARIDGASDTPVPDAINSYLSNLNFNGEYANTRLMDALQAVDGVSLVNIIVANAKYGLLDFTQIDEKYIADSGYLSVTPENLIINYRQYVQR